MVRLLVSALAVLSFLSSVALADDAGTSCKTSSCPESLPCCSQYGQCGVGAFCLGGCDPLLSHTLDSCMPAPVCNSADFKLDSLDTIEANTKYLGDASKANWVSSGSPVAYPMSSPDSVLLTMPKDSVGTLLASTAYVWYGKISATMKTSRGQGVVTAFILLSDVKDEIDFEFVGVDLNTAQSNFYFQGELNYTNSVNLTVQDSFDDYHTYEIDWNPDTIVWSIDGKALRTLHKDATFNATTNQYNYPQTPSRIQLSLWPAGLSTNGQGTVDWAGGLIDWNAPDVKNTGYYYARVSDVNVQCYSPPSEAKSTGTKSYLYYADSGLNNSIEITNDDTILSSFEGTGVDPKKGGQASASANGAAQTDSSPNVPGLGKAGTGNNGARGSATGSLNGGGSGANPSTPTASTFHGWSQGNSKGSSASSVRGEMLLQGSLLAMLLAIAGLLVM